MDVSNDVMSYIISGKYDIKILDGDKKGDFFAQLVEKKDFTLYLEDGDDLISKFFDDNPEIYEDYDINEYYPKIVIELIPKDSSVEKTERIALRDDSLIDELRKSNEIITASPDEFKPGTYVFEFLGINCSYGKIRGLISYDDLKDAFEDEDMDFNENTTDDDLCDILEGVLLNNFEWDFEVDDCIVYYILSS